MSVLTTELEALRAENARLRAHVDRCPYGPLGEEWWCTHIPPHADDDCYEEDGNTVRRAPLHLGPSEILDAAGDGINPALFD